MQVAISALHFPWRDLDACFRIAGDELGLDGVELSWHRSQSRPHCTAQDLERLRRLHVDTGMALSAHIWENLPQVATESAAQSLLDWLELCEATGVAGLVIHGGSFPEREQGVQRLRCVLEQVVPSYERAGVVLYLENHYAFEYHDCCELFSEPWEFRRVFSLDSPALRFCFDTGHAHMTRNIKDLIQELAPWLGYVHLADNHGEHDDHCAFGEGTVPWQSVLSSLRGVGFNGTLCVEFPVRDDRAPFRQCMTDIRAHWPLRRERCAGNGEQSGSS